MCDLSGESKHAQRSVRKPIKFHGTVYPEFNKTLQAFVNRTNIFPDYFDVKKCLEHCNTQYNMRLRAEEIRLIGKDPFFSYLIRFENNKNSFPPFSSRRLR